MQYNLEHILEKFVNKQIRHNYLIGNVNLIVDVNLISRFLMKQSAPFCVRARPQDPRTSAAFSDDAWCVSWLSACRHANIQLAVDVTLYFTASASTRMSGLLCTANALWLELISCLYFSCKLFNKLSSKLLHDYWI